MGPPDESTTPVMEPPTSVELTKDGRLAILAVGQHDVVSLGQLCAAGFSRSAVQRMVRAGRLRLLHRGVYLIGHGPLTDRGRIMAAVLAAGSGSAASHVSAAQVHGLLPWRGRLVHVTSPRQPPERRGVVGHRSGQLHARDVVHVDRIPVTTIARTFVDAAGEVGRQGVERMWRRADELRVLDVHALMREVATGRRGASLIRQVLATADEGLLGRITRSDLEILFLEAVRLAGLPLPQTNASVDVGGVRREVDALWRGSRLAVELDGWETHGTRNSFEDDRRRDEQLVRAGYRTVRFTWRRVVADPAGVTATVRALLASEVDP
jgi:predicted transcriptional regulator of viral defense system